jgi:hypothetical protein
MGREATCHCKWGGEESDCKVLLEGPDLIFRLGMRRRVSVSTMAGVSAVNGKLVFRVGQDRVELGLGPDLARRWLKAIKTPPPSLAAKLGISSTTNLQVIGDVPTEELNEAIAQAGSGSEINLVLLCVDSPSALSRYFKSKACGTPVWVIYPKGPGSELKESLVRDLFRSRDFIDTKVASVSAKLTALRFVKRKS